MAQVITTILLEDNPKGLLLIEMANWSGKAFVVPRGRLKVLKSREDAAQPGLYFLFGEGGERPTAYVGQSENVVERLFSHDSNRKKDAWNIAFVFIGELDGASIKYLESISFSLAKKAGRYDILNAITPKENKLSEAQRITVSEYFERVKIITALFGYFIFEEQTLQRVGATYYFEDAKNKDASAKGALLDSGEFVVFDGSLSRIKETYSFKGSGPALRRKLVEEGVLQKINEESYGFTTYYIFKSPSAASDTVAGRSTNGWTGWKDKSGKTLDENIRK